MLLLSVLLMLLIILMLRMLHMQLELLERFQDRQRWMKFGGNGWNWMYGGNGSCTVGKISPVRR